jgi:hypothetical protein
MARLISRAELARLAKVSDVAISKACKARLAPACVEKRIDLDHPAVLDYLASKGVAPPRKLESEPPPPPAEERPSRRELADDDEDEDAEDLDVEHFADLTLRQLTDRFGTKVRFKDWLDARKKIADIQEKDLKNDETTGRLIERELVRTHVFGAIEASNKRLLQDAPKNIARRIYAMAAANVPAEEAERTVREIIGSNLAAVKATAVRVLRPNA